MGTKYSYFIMGFLCVVIVLSAALSGASVCDNASSLQNKKEISLHKDFIIENKLGEDTYLFAGPVGLDVDRKGNIYVLEGKDCQVKVFDANGAYKFSFGKKGQGPGELQAPNSLSIKDDADEIWICDRGVRRVVVYSLSGEYIKQITTGSILSINELDIHSGGNPFALILQIDRYAVAKLEKDLSDYHTLMEHKFDMTSDDKGPSARIFPPRLHFCLSSAHVIAGYSDQYELKVMDFNGKAVGTIRKKSDPVKLTPGMRDFIIDLQTSGRGYPEGWNVIELDHLPAYMNLSSDDQGRIYVGTFERPEGQPDHYYFDVFAPDGDFLTRFPLQMHDFRMPLIWKNNSLYMIDMNRDGDYFIKKMDVEWEQLSS